MLQPCRGCLAWLLCRDSRGLADVVFKGLVEVRNWVQFSEDRVFLLRA